MARSNWILSCCTLMYLSFVVIGIVFCSIDLDRFAWCLYLILVSLVGCMICVAFCMMGHHFDALPGRNGRDSNAEQHSQAAKLLIATFQRSLMRSAAVGGFRANGGGSENKISNSAIGSKTSSTALTRPTLLDVHAH
uniref:Uncharacterized protein n=1 Tax=Romanomermis culicivorax TaxID=13658 RepID=A0A915J9U7_ROMCU